MHSVSPNAEQENSDVCGTDENMVTVTNDENSTEFDGISSSECNYKQHYKEMKRNLRLLIYVSSSLTLRS